MSFCAIFLEVYSQIQAVWPLGGTKLAKAYDNPLTFISGMAV